ncbi:MFS transporter [Streptomyces sp. NPDC058620]|uniref:MFS transporter n=1 Tax=Streptomyces sp. NPDC058620 TaxID=3346560 RepID=UPI0036522A89
MRTAGGRAAGDRHRTGLRHSPAQHHLGFWLVATVFTLIMAFSTVPTPLYPLYERADGFGPFVVTIVFATYAVGVLVALFLAGHLSDWYGRRTVLLPAIVLSIASALVFASWTSLPALLVARLLSGLSVGLLTATATALLADLHQRARPGASRTRANVVATGANLGGLGLGPLVSGLFAEHAAERSFWLCWCSGPPWYSVRRRWPRSCSPVRAPVPTCCWGCRSWRPAWSS